MADLKSLAEIKLEVDLIMVDIEVLGESDKSEAIKYLETSLEELKLVSNWEIQSSIDNYRSENSKEIKAEGSDELEHEYIDAKRLKFEIPKADEALKIDGQETELEEEESIEKDLDYPGGSMEELAKYEELSLLQEQQFSKNSESKSDEENLGINDGYIDSQIHLAEDNRRPDVDIPVKSADLGGESAEFDCPMDQTVAVCGEPPEDFIKEEKIPEYVESVENLGWEQGFDVSKEYTGHLDSETFYPPYSQQDSYFYQNGPDKGHNEKLLEESAPDDDNFEETVSSFDSFSTAYPTNVEPVTQFYRSSAINSEAAQMTNLNSDEPFVAPREHSSGPVSSHVLYNGKIPTCTECNLTFPSLGVLDTHLKNGHRPSSHIAKRPSSPAARSIEYVQSELPEIYQNDDGTFQCPFCSHSSKYKYNLKLHVNKHTGKYRCDACDVNLYNRHTLDNHNKTPDHLNRVNQLPPPVSINSQTAGLDSYYQAAAQEMPGRDEVAEQLYDENVSVDGRNFSMDHLLDSSPHQMEEFGQNYSLDPEPTPVSQSSLNDYMNRQIYNQELLTEKPHSNLQKTFSCGECGNTYTKSVSFRRHLISHSDRFKCQTCGNGFTEQGRLNAHLRSKENCKKLLQKRGLPNDNVAAKEPNWPQGPYTSNTKWTGNNFEENKADFPPGLIVARKSLPPVQNSYSNSLGQNSSLAEKFFSNPNLSVQMKSEPVRRF